MYTSLLRNSRDDFLATSFFPRPQRRRRVVLEMYAAAAAAAAVCFTSSPSPETRVRQYLMLFCSLYVTMIFTLGRSRAVFFRSLLLLLFYFIIPLWSHHGHRDGLQTRIPFENYATAYVSNSIFSNNVRSLTDPIILCCRRRVWIYVEIHIHITFVGTVK